MKNNKDLRIMLREAGILFAITLVAGLMLGFVYELTKEPIRIQKEKAVQETCAAVFEAADHFMAISGYAADADLTEELAGQGVEIGQMFEAKDASDTLLGYVVETTSTEGYGGDIVLYVGVTLEGTINDISILDISETPGLGMQAAAVLGPQFHNKKSSEFTYTKTGSRTESEIDAISGATVTTEAVVNAVNGGLKAVRQMMEGGSVNE